MMSSFEEKFPSLMPFVFKTVNGNREKITGLINSEDVQMLCLDKQKVKEAIEKLSTFGFDGEDTDVSRENKSLINKSRIKFLKKELELEGE
jgi:hypothetical protein